MLGTFTYCNPTKLYFGKGSLKALKEELGKYGPRVMLSYGGGSIKKNGIYDSVTAILRAAKKEIIEDGGVMPNPTIERVEEGVRRARTGKADLILAVGGGSVCDYAKAVSASVHLSEKENIWDKYFSRFEEPTCKIVPVGCVLTMAGTGSEMNGGSVITNRALHLKIGHVFGEKVFPVFSILDPTFTFTVPREQMIAGIFDIMSHILEQYLSGSDDNTSDYLAEGLLRSLIHSAEIAVKDPQDYEARSNIMWTATWALNTLIAKGKSEDWNVHMIGQAVGAYTDATHGMTLSAVSVPYYKYILPYGTKKFARLAETVWGVERAGRSDTAMSYEGLDRMARWMRELGLVMNLTELGVTRDMVEGIIQGTVIMHGGYKQLDERDIRAILLASL